MSPSMKNHPAMLLLCVCIAMLMVLTGCGKAQPAPTTTVTQTVTATPSPTPTRDQSAYLAEMAGQVDMDSETKLALGNAMCDLMASGLSPKDAALATLMGRPIDTYAESYRFGRAIVALCPDAVN